MSTGSNFDFQPTSYTLMEPVDFTMTSTGFTTTTWVNLAEQTLSGLTWTPPAGYGTPNADGSQLTFRSTPTRDAQPGPSSPAGPAGVGPIEHTFDTLEGGLLVTANDWFLGILPYNFRSLAKPVQYNP